eukprot:2016002-Alexandrium_andersonii.AAC.1
MLRPSHHLGHSARVQQHPARAALTLAVGSQLLAPEAVTGLGAVAFNPRCGAASSEPTRKRRL